LSSKTLWLSSLVKTVNKKYETSRLQDINYLTIQFLAAMAAALEPVPNK
jgi:hypothetical protein